jgi:hypothetical protein
LPPGFVGAPAAVGECTPAQLTENACPRSSQVGRIELTLTPTGVFDERRYESYAMPVFNMTHPVGVVNDLAFSLVGNPVHIRASLDPEKNYAVKTVVPNINETTPVYFQKLTLWGVPADPSHDWERCISTVGMVDSFPAAPCPTDWPRQAFLTVPFDCQGNHAMTISHVNSWQNPGVFEPAVSYPDPPARASECDKPQFEPSVQIEPTGRAANTPTGLAVRIEVPQTSNPNALGTPPVKRVEVTFPEGMTVSPSFADGLTSCSLGQIGLRTDAPVACPDSSRIGAVELSTPLLPEPLEGSIYLADQARNPFGSLLAVYLAVHDNEDRGILVKVPGRIDLDPNTGQLSSTFDDLPQFPFDDLTLSFRSGPRAPLINPPTCGTHTIGVEMSSYARPNQPVDVSNTYQVAEGPSGSACADTPASRPFEPRLSGGTSNPLAGAFSPLHLRAFRSDADQELSSVEGAAPLGLSASLRGVGRCSEAAIAAAVARSQPGQGALEIAAPSCPASSQVGTIETGAGAGPTPIYVPGKIYMAGPYRGAPLSGVGIVPAVAGPLDLGVVVVRAPAYVDPRTARVRIATDQLPQIIHGVLIRVRDVRIHLDRPDFILNPTSCAEKSIDATAFSTAGAVKQLNQRFQVGDCARLGFKPRLSIELRGGTRRGDNPALRAVLRARPGDANIRDAQVTLPKSAFLDQQHIRTICTRPQFAAGACPKAAQYGYARAFTPLLDEPLQGPVYLRSSDNDLPDLAADLEGLIDLEVVGRIDSFRGGIRSTFESVPDAPVSKFVLTMQGGRKGLVVNSRNLCARPSRAAARFVGQNGKPHRFRPVVKPTECGRKGKKRKGDG